MKPVSSLAYRPDVDGLRALAVVPVVLFHAGFAGLSGGFVGVDVFFVISGYLITSIIIYAMDRGTFSITWFYERRVRRILPALVAMLLAATIASFVFLQPRNLADLGASLLAASAFASNFYFAEHSGYFFSDSVRPLLHTWSLGVEEQYYIFWPLILLACYRLGRSRLKIIVAGVAVASFAACVSALATDQSLRASFYLTQYRAWELMLGAALAVGLFPRLPSLRANELLGWMGIGMIVYSIIQFSPATAFPGYWAAVPSVGAALILYSGEKQGTSAARLLSLPPLVFIGLISYSLYLWHWPILIFGEVYVERSLHVREALALIAVSVIVAALSWRYIERPFRFGGDGFRFTRRAYLSGGFASLALAGSLGHFIHLSNGFPERLMPETRAFVSEAERNNPMRDRCHSYGTKPSPLADCLMPAASRDSYDVIVWGDFVADAIVPGLAIVGEKRGFSLRQATASGCLPLLDVDRLILRPGGWSTRHCAEFNSALLDELKAGPRPQLAVLTGRWSMYTSGTKPVSYLVDSENRSPDTPTTRRVLERALMRTVDAINELGISVLLIGQVPEFPVNPNECLVRRELRNLPSDDCLTMTRKTADHRHEISRRILTNVAQARPKVEYLGLEWAFCDEASCSATRGRLPLYQDAYHLSLTGARVVGGELATSGKTGLLFSR